MKTGSTNSQHEKQYTPIHIEIRYRMAAQTRRVSELRIDFLKPKGNNTILPYDCYEFGRI